MKKVLPTLSRLHRLLVVDDEEATLRLLLRALSDEYDVEPCNSPESALAAIRRNPDFSLVLTDHEMGTMSGVDFLARTRSVIPSAMRLLVTGHPQAQVAIDAVAGSDIAIHDGRALVTVMPTDEDPATLRAYDLGGFNL